MREWRAASWQTVSGTQMSVRHEGGEGNLREVLLMSHWCRWAKRYVTGQEDLRLVRKQNKTHNKCKGNSIYLCIYVDFVWNTEGFLAADRHCCVWFHFIFFTNSLFCTLFSLPPPVFGDWLRRMWRMKRSGRDADEWPSIGSLQQLQEKDSVIPLSDFKGIERNPSIPQVVRLFRSIILPWWRVIFLLQGFTDS